MNSGKYLYKFPSNKKLSIAKKVNVRKLLYLIYF